MEIEVGNRVRVTLAGVPEWKIPEQVQEATVTAENREALLADIAEQVEFGNAKVEVIA